MPTRFVDMAPEEMLYGGYGSWTWSKVARSRQGLCPEAFGVYGATSGALKAGSVTAVVTGMSTLLTTPMGWVSIALAAVAAGALVAHKLC